MVIRIGPGSGERPRFGWELREGNWTPNPWCHGSHIFWVSRVALYRYYRNTDKSHSFEHETAVEAKPVTGSDEKVDKVTGTRETRIRGDNVHAYRTRVQRIRDNPKQGDT